MSTRGAVATLLEQAGHGVVGRTIWLGRQPASTEYPSIVVTGYGGNVLETYGTSEQQPFVQVMVTGKPGDDDENEALADQVWNTLANSGSFELDGTAINIIRPTTVPLDLGTDGSDRSMRSINIEVTHGG